MRSGDDVNLRHAGIDPPIDGQPRLLSRASSLRQARAARLRQSRCLDPLLSTMCQRLFASAPPLPENTTGDAAPETLPPAPRPETNVSMGSRQLSRTELQLVPLVGAEAVANTPCARLSEPYEVEM